MSNALRNLKITAVVSACAHTLGAFAMAFFLARGLDTNPDLKNRIEYILMNPLLWKLGWFTWNISALSFLVYIYYFVRFHLKSDIERAGKTLLFAALGMTILAVLADLIFESREMFFIPDLVLDSQRTDIERAYLINHQIFLVGSGIIANLLYCLGTLFSVSATKHHYPKWVQYLGYGIFVIGVSASIACMIASVPLMFWSNAFLVPLIVLWLLGVAWKSAESAVTN